MKISDNLKMFTECQQFRYGRIPICFLGDFCQLEPINGDCIYTNLNGLYWQQALNCMVELKGTHRFSNCPDYQRIITSLREGIFTDEDG
jgi:hypothetical protein